MTKFEYLNALAGALTGIPDAAKCVAYYGEIIDDRIEDGMSEEAAVASRDDIYTVRERLIAETPLPAFLKEKGTRKVSTGMIVLLVLGFPLWFPLLMAGGAVALSWFVVVACLIFSAIVIVLALSFGGIAMVIVACFRFAASPAYGLFTVGGGFMAIGLSLLLIWPAMAAVRWLLWLIGFTAKGIKSVFVGKRKVKVEYAAEESL
jgi:uncharacterized membrane protein